MFPWSEENNFADFAEIEFCIDGQTFDDLSKITKQSPFLIYTTLFTVFNICLYKYSGIKEISIGSPALLTENKTENFQPYNLIIQTLIHSEQTFKTLLTEAHETLKADYQNQNFDIQATR